MDEHESPGWTEYHKNCAYFREFLDSVCSTIHLVYRCSQDIVTVDSIWVVQTDKHILYFLFMYRTNYRLLLDYAIITPKITIVL